MNTYNELYLFNKHALQNSGDENCEFNARLILAHASGKDVSQLLSSKNLYSSPDIELKNSEYLNRLINGEPIAYILNSWEFYGLPFYVDKNVLIPRIDTEVIIETVKELYPEPESKLRILDLCTGSGNIACTLAHEYPNSKITAVDISRGAIEICRKNIQNLRLGAQISCINSDVLMKPDSRIGTFDLIVSNPPYIKSSEIHILDSSVKDYEPLLALDGGKDGYDYYRAIIENYSDYLNQDSYMVFEVGENQSQTVLNFLRRKSYSLTDFRQDTVGTERVVFGRK